MLESRCALPVRVWDLTIKLPLAEQEGFAARFRGLLMNIAQVLALHYENEFGVFQEFRS